MKFTTILIALFCCVFFGCSDTNKFARIAQASAEAQAAGFKIDYENVEIKMIDTFTYNEVMSDFYEVNKEKDQTLPEFEKKLDELVKYLKDENNNKYKVWYFKQQRIAELKKHNPEDVCYYIVYNKYKFTNPIMGNTRMENKYYFMIDSEDNVLAKLSEYDHKDDEAGQPKSLKYEQALYENSFKNP
jgi:hypothetical protein